MPADKTKNYENPHIMRIDNPLVTKHGMAPAYSVPVMKTIDNARVAELAGKYGSPLFVFSEKQIKSRFKKTLDAFRKNYPKVTFGWSYKTNYLKTICRLFHAEGAWAEVVSGFEYERARSLGVPGKRIIYNGPYKPYESLKLAVSEGARIHIDSTDEIGDLERIAAELGTTPRVAIRIHMDTGIFPPWSRFGFNYENGQARQAVERIRFKRRLSLEGLHTHIGTFILDKNAYRLAAKKMVAMMKVVEEVTGGGVSYIDLGGGFASMNWLRGIYQPPEISIPKIEDYAEAITSTLKEELSGRPLPELVLETGRYLIDEAGYLVTTVVASKLLPDARRAYVLDAGVNIMYTSTWYRHKVFLESPEKSLPAPSALMGPLCMNIDVLDESIMLPRLPRGKHLIIHPAGAYNTTLWTQFSQYRPAVVLIRENGSVDLIRSRENLADMDICEQLPKDLRCEK
ncbi:MAG: alanine racemase [Elusimicrobiota bacterium]